MEKVIVTVLILQAIKVIPIETSIMATNIIKENVEVSVQDFSVPEVVASLAVNNVKLH
ncbi:hypothetical protein ACOQFO_12120 [Ureibacillus sp. MALMAid1270]|uniref:hypothetical protein n=1 Tax=Ureibacillus sp. MALMAid1270 TaxID=3411629 RepID=UPI003BA3F0F7